MEPLKLSLLSDLLSKLRCPIKHCPIQRVKQNEQGGRKLTGHLPKSGLLSDRCFSQIDILRGEIKCNSTEKGECKCTVQNVEKKIQMMPNCVAPAVRY